MTKQKEPGQACSSYWGQEIDLHLMLAVNGKERSIAECSVLFDKVGLRTIRTMPLDNGYVVIETAPA